MRKTVISPSVSYASFPESSSKVDLEPSRMTITESSFVPWGFGGIESLKQW